MYVGILCACLPCLRAFIKHYFPNLFVFDDAFEHRLTSIRLSIPLTMFSGNRGNADAEQPAGPSAATAPANESSQSGKESKFSVGGGSQPSPAVSLQEKSNV
jgi:hypothetical protein